jgi:transposase-like protein
MGYAAVGRKYGVSDNAVRKWVRWYEGERERSQAESGADAQVVDLGDVRAKRQDSIDDVA